MKKYFNTFFYLLSGLVAINVIYLLYWLFSLSQPIPLGDHMDIAINLLRYMGYIEPEWNGGLKDVLLHNEHLIATTDLFTAIDIILFDSTSTFLVFISLLSQIVTTGTLLISLRRFGLDINVFRLTFLGIVVMMLSGSNIDNFIWGSQVQFTQVYMFASISLILFLRGIIENKSKMIIGGIVAAIFSALSMANGALILLMITMISLWRYLLDRNSTYKLRIFIGTLICSSLWLVLYVVLKQPQLNNLKFSADVFEKITFVLSFLGQPVTYYSSDLGIMFGVFGLIVSLWLNFYCMFHKTRETQTLSLPLILIIDFILLTAILISFGRAEIAPRYNTPALLFWSAVLVLCVGSHQSIASWNRLFVRIGIILSMFVLVYSILFQFKEVERWKKETDEKLIATAAVVAGVEDVDAFRALYPWDNRVQSFVKIAKQLHLSIFSNFVRPTRNFYVDDVPSCNGEVINIKELPLLEKQENINVLGGLRVNGLVSKASFSGVKLKDIIVTTLTANVVGYGYVEQFGNGQINWNAFINTKSIDSVFTIFAYSKSSGSVICKITTARLEPKISFSELRESVQNISYRVNGDAWSENGFNPAADQKFFSGPVWGSAGAGGKNDALTGSLLIGPFATPADAHFLVIPAVIGPTKNDLSLRLLSAQDRNILAEFNLGKLETHVWGILTLDISSINSNQQFFLEAKDSGQLWGQWFAVGPPFIFSGPTWMLKN